MRCLPAAWMLALACLVASPALGETFDLPLPAGLKPLRIPDDNPLTEAKVHLGKQLYFDPRLSRDNSLSCSSCHDPAKGWSNGERFATGIGGQVGGRSAPTIINSAYQRLQFWDGRADELEGQALGPIQNPIEMNMPIEELVEKLNAIPGYHEQFEAIFGTPATPDTIAKAIASFERTVLSGDSPYDRYEKGDKEALSPAAQRGHEVFFHKAHCSACHQPPNFTDGAFHNIGVGIDDEKPDEGRHVLSKLLGDRGAFKTPTLREISRTSPYMHDGRFQTLEEVVEHYDKGGTPNDQLDEEIFPLRLKPQDKADLIVFLKEALASEKYPLVEPPELPE